MSCDEDNNMKIIVLPSMADAYMQDSVPVFVKNSTVRTPGPAPCMCQTLPGNNLSVVDKVYWRPSLGMERPLAIDSDEQRVITLTDSGLLQLFWAHGLDLDRRGMFFHCMILPFFSLCFGSIIFSVFSVLALGCAFGTVLSDWVCMLVLGFCVSFFLTLLIVKVLLIICMVSSTVVCVICLVLC